MKDDRWLCCVCKWKGLKKEFKWISSSTSSKCFARVAIAEYHVTQYEITRYHTTKMGTMGMGLGPAIFIMLTVRRIIHGRNIWVGSHLHSSQTATLPSEGRPEACQPVGPPTRTLKKRPKRWLRELNKSRPYEG